MHILLIVINIYLFIYLYITKPCIKKRDLWRLVTKTPELLCFTRFMVASGLHVMTLNLKKSQNPQSYCYMVNRHNYDYELIQQTAGEI